MLWISLAFAEDPIQIVASDRDVAYGGFGSSAAAGDWDGDGIEDLAVGAPEAYDGGNDSGAAYVGSASSGELGEVLRGNTPIHNGQFGWTMVNAGDVDQDGFEDLLVGAPTEHGDSDYEGVAWLFLGSTTGLVTSPEQQINAALDSGAAFAFSMVGGFDSDADGNVEVAVGAANDETVHWFESDTNRFDLEKARESSIGLENSGYGWALAAADFDGDGFDDVAVGAPRVEEHTGAVLLHNAGALGGIELTSGFAEPGARFGAALANAGDTNGDGYPDLAVGALGDSQKFSQSGAVYVYLGSSSGPRSLDEYLLLPLEAAPDDQFGARVAGSDLDGDGYSEVIASAPPAEDSAGSLHIFPGSPSGPDISGEDTWEPDDTESGDELGGALLGLVDLDADGVDDLVLGAPGDDEDRGSAWLIWGCRDEDLDGLCFEADCDDTDAGVGAPLGWFYADEDGDGFGDPEVYEAVCFSTEGWVENDLDCDDQDAETFPGAAAEDAGCTRDQDGDGYGDASAEAPVDAGQDCNDADASVRPGAEELPSDDIDQDCDGAELCYDDDDGDGWRDETVVLSDDLDCDDEGEATNTELDCNDADASIHPQAEEIPGDGIDQDCDGEDASTPDTGEDADTPDDPDGCGCVSGPRGGLLLGPWLLALLALVRREHSPR